MYTELIQKTRGFARLNMGKEPSHDFSHALRVASMTKQIAIEESFDKPYLYELTGLLHDIGLGVGERKNHGEIGAQMAKDFLTENAPTNFLENDLEELVYAISWHNRKMSAPSKSVLLDVLADADTLDLLGAIGIWRGILSLTSQQELTADALINANAKFKDYDNSLKEKREKNDHGWAEQLNFQMKSAEIITTQTAQKMAKPLLATMKSFRYMLAHELTLYQNRE